MSDGTLILGFDARAAEPRDWDPGRKVGYLFRPEAVFPLSLDSRVWPSVLGPEGGPGLFQLWESLRELRDRLAGVAVPAVVAAFGRRMDVLSEEERAALETFLRGVHPDGTPGSLPAAIADPADVDPGWRFLGYDVTDLGGLSGLMNCGFLPGQDDVEALRRRWGPRLNRHHLFDRLEDAREFKDFSNRRVEEHAPFYVDGIWLVSPLRQRMP